MGDKRSPLALPTFILPESGNTPGVLSMLADEQSAVVIKARREATPEHFH
jgi:hypothetical protein